jgi:hypothetical protein
MNRAEAHHIRLAHLFDPVLAVHTHEVMCMHQSFQHKPDFGVTSVNYT